MRIAAFFYQDQPHVGLVSQDLNSVTPFDLPLADRELGALTLVDALSRGEALPAQGAAMMQSLPQGYRAVVFGASGAIGEALVQRLKADPRCQQVLGITRTTQPGFDLLDEASAEWLDASGQWTERLQEAFVARHAEAVDALEAAGKQAFASNLVVDVNVIEIEEKDGKLRPLRLRERIRAEGPTIAYAEGHGYADPAFIAA